MARTTVDNLKNPEKPEKPERTDWDAPYRGLRDGRKRVILNDDGKAAETKP